jgi:hypothetical protein
MPDNLKSLSNAYKAANEFLHATPSSFKMGLLTLITLVVVLLAVVEVLNRFKEKIKWLSEMEEKHPKSFGFFYGGKFRTGLLVVVVILLLIDWRDVTTISPPTLSITLPVPKNETCKASICPSQPSSNSPTARSNSIGACTAVPTGLQAAQPTNPPQSAHDQLVSAQSQLHNLNSKWTEITNREAARHIAPASQVISKTEEQRVQIEGESIALFYFTANEFGREWQAFDQNLNKIHNEALERKARPGVHQWTANERDQDGQEFLRVLNQAEHVPTYSEIRSGKIPDRFTPLVNYLGGLQKILGDFHD